MCDVEEIPRLVNPEKRPCLDGQTQLHSPTTVAAAVSKVLDDDNLLREIIVRVGFPTTLVRAAVVCKRWLCHISDRKFLSRFRKLNPPRLLGIYIDNWPVSKQETTLHFVPMLPQPPELAAVVRRVASNNIGAHKQLCILDCRNGSIFAKRCEGGVMAHEVHRPLCPEPGMCIVPPPPTAQDPIQLVFARILSREENGSLSYLHVLAEWITGTTNLMVCVYMLQDGVWRMHTSVTEQIPDPAWSPKATLAGNKIYMAGQFIDYIIVLDLTASSLSRILLPHGVTSRWFSTALSQADDTSSVYLTHLHVSELQLHIWLHKGDNWLLVHTIYLHKLLANTGMLDHTLEDDEDIDFPYICQVGDNAEFVILQMCGYALYLDVKSKTLCKVHGSAGNARYYSKIYPFMMTWPPIFPALKDDPAGMSCEEL
ncbi:hypothetical protein QYE76_063286 [Lolium multiflorum]|uniref:F-box protein AT5G49610-like beta-propeller domain-containing protein n=1 Tax=Lolium multiflorum TaxID=4521 RepID=A0AAD8W6E9_LOLMU|nr:hypothetical protein QYE76_063286 [Lolium multiflorum]